MSSVRRALVCAPLVPDFDRESGSQRLVDLIGFLQQYGYEVTFVAHHRGRSARYETELQQRGVATYLGLNVETRKMITEGRFELALLAFWQIAETWLPQIRKLSPSTRILVDSVDLHFLRNSRKIFQTTGDHNESGMLGSEYAADMIRELNTYAAADAVLTVSSKESVMINDLIGAPLCAFPVPDCEEIGPSTMPFEDRRGILFVGNFRHPPNVQALHYLCNLVLPQLDSDLAAEHPVYIVGNALEHAGKIWRYNPTLSHVQMIGWVPSVLPYLERARITVLPLQYGAGTKRKLIQALMMGTPAVSTSVGVEGLDLQHGEHVLIADQPGVFARSISHLLRDVELWQHVEQCGRRRIRRTHSKAAAHMAFGRVLDAVQDRWPKPGDMAQDLKLHRRGFNHPYDRLLQRIQETVSVSLPLGTTVLVVSKGDDDLLELGGRRAWHFPRAADGNYAGNYPATGAEAVSHLEGLRSMGAEFLVFPWTSIWWLDHYPEFKQHLDVHYRLVVTEAEVCLVYALQPSVESKGAGPVLPSARGGNTDSSIEEILCTVPDMSGAVDQALVDETDTRNNAPGAARSSSDVTIGREVVPRQDLEDAGAITPARNFDEVRSEPVTGQVASVRNPDPSLTAEAELARIVRSVPSSRVLVLGICLVDRPHYADHIIEVLSASQKMEVTQKWVTLGGPPTSKPLAAVTTKSINERVPKYEILNRLLEHEDLSQYEYVIITDDDVRLPTGFTDYFVGLQRKLGFALAQPARTSASFIDFPIVEQQRGVLARETLLVEIGPVMSAHCSAFESVFPFDLASPMGWGYESVWAYRLARLGLKLGIIDAVPVDHSLRKPVANYAWEMADAGRTALLRKHPHYSLEHCFRVLEIITPGGSLT